MTTPRSAWLRRPTSSPSAPPTRSATRSNGCSQEQVDHLPVIDGDQLVGICTRTDIMRARRSQFAHEQTEPGWLARKSTKPPSTSNRRG